VRRCARVAAKVERNRKEKQETKDLLKHSVGAAKRDFVAMEDIVEGGIDKENGLAALTSPGREEEQEHPPSKKLRPSPEAMGGSEKSAETESPSQDVEEDSEKEWKGTVQDMKKMPPDSISLKNLRTFEEGMASLETAQAGVMVVYEAVDQSLVKLFETTLQTVTEMQSQIAGEVSALEKTVGKSMQQNMKHRNRLVHLLESKKNMISRVQNDILYCPSEEEDEEADENPTEADEDGNQPNWSELVETEPSELSRKNIHTFIDGLGLMQEADERFHAVLDETRAGLIECIERIRALTDQSCSSMESTLQAQQGEIQYIMIANNQRRLQIACDIKESLSHLTNLDGFLSNLLNRVS
jgi:hypothetical protein